MNVVSVCSGGGGGDKGLVDSGMTLVAACEKDPHARAVLRFHHPSIPIYHDIAEVTHERLRADGIVRVDLVTGGTPCQDLSLAGGRAGLAGEQSRLFHEFVRVADDIAPPWVLWENVDGALSSGRGEDFAVVLGELSGFRPAVPGAWRSGGWCQGFKRTVAWRVLDARGFGVAQRRYRLFALGGAGTLAARAVEVLFEPEGGAGHLAPSDRTEPEPAEPAGNGADRAGEPAAVGALDINRGGRRQHGSSWAPGYSVPLIDLHRDPARLEQTWIVQ